MTTDPNVADPVKLAAIKDTLDRSGLAAKTAVSVEVGGKPLEMVFDSIMAGPRNAQPALAIEGENAPAIEPDREILGEFDDPPDDDDEIADYPPGIQRGRESESTVIDVEIVDAGYTDAPMTIGSDTTTPNDPDSSRSVDLGATPYPRPLGPTGPTGSGLLSLQDAVEAAAAMRTREAARIRDMRRR